MKGELVYSLHWGPLSDDLLSAVAALEARCFESSQLSCAQLQAELELHRRCLLVLARWQPEDQALEPEGVGFKLGFARRRQKFVSWKGGVVPQFRRRGIARALMRLQHRELASGGFTTVRTLTGNEFRGMLLLNIQEGFEIRGTSIASSGALRIILDKQLDARETSLDTCLLPPTVVG